MRVGFLLLGNAPFYKTGYGTQLKILGDQLIEEGYPVGHVVDFGYAGHIMEWEGRTIYPADKLPGTLTSTTMKNHIDEFQGKHGLDEVIVWSLGDTWKLSKLNETVKHPYWICMTPIDSDRIDNGTINAHNNSWQQAAISEHGVEIMTSSGLPNINYLPHMVGDAFKPINKEYARTACGIPSNAFAVGFFGDMSMRKCPHENLEAFAMFKQRVPNAVLFIKTSNHIQEVQFKELIHKLNLQHSVIAIPPYDSLVGLSDEEMARALSSLDVLLHVSSQEGFGIIQVEAQMCGVPVINMDYGSQKQLQGNPELSVPVAQMNRVDGGMKVPYAIPEQIAEKLMAVYTLHQNPNEDDSVIVQKAVEHAENYRTSRVWKEHYKPFLTEIIETMETATRLAIPPRPLKKVGLVSTFDTECGIATYTHMLATNLIKQGLEVVVFSETVKDAPDEPYAHEYHLEHEGVRHHRCWNRMDQATIPFRELVEAEECDVIHFQHEWQVFKNTGLVECLRDYEGKKAITYHTPQPEQMGGLLRVTDSLVDAHITHWPETTQMLAMTCKHGLLNGIQTIKHGVLEHTREQDKSIFGIPEKVPVFFTFGFASASKGLDYFIDAAIQASKDPDCRYFEVVIAMSYHPDWDMSTLAQEIRAKAASVDFITLIEGWMDEDSLDLHAAACDYLVFPYRWFQQIHSASGAVRRVLGHGKPVLVTDEGRLRDLTGGVHGWKFGQYDVDGFADSIVDASSLLGSSRYGKMAKAVKMYSSSTSWTNVASQHISVYDKICGLWTVVPEAMSKAQRVDVDIPFPELLDSDVQQDRWHLHTEEE